MLPKPKQIVIDKEALIGINVDVLCDFAKHHLVLACDTLLYECATASHQEPKNMLERYGRLIKSGAYYCSCSVTYTHSEGRNSDPYPWFLPDMEATNQIRTGEAQLESVLDSPKTGAVFQSRGKVAKAIFLDLSDKLNNRISIENPDVAKKIRQLPSDISERFRMFFESIDARDLHQTCVDSYSYEWINDEKKFCSSPEWMSWQLIRLTDAIVQNYYYLRQTSSMPRDEDERAEHDYQDMEYVLLLSRADVLLTGDKKLVKLAKAAFPDKDVFSSLDEVPEEYACNWS